MRTATWSISDADCRVKKARTVQRTNGVVEPIIVQQVLALEVTPLESLDSVEMDKPEILIACLGYLLEKRNLSEGLSNLSSGILLPCTNCGATC